MKNTGALLKSKRESSDLSLSEVALATKINPKILAAIENGDEAHLPAKTFLKGFVRSYALFLKMDVDQVMRSFQDETGGPPPERQMEATKSEPSTPASRRRVGDESSSGLRTIAVVVIVVLIGLIIGVRELIEKYQRERVVESTADIKVTPVPAPVGAEQSEMVSPVPTEVETDETIVETPAEAEVKPEQEPAAETKLVEVKAEEAKPDPPKVAETKPVEPPTPAERPKPVVVARAMDLIRAPLNNLVELPPNQLSPPRPAEVKAVEPKPAEAKVEEPPKPAEVKPAEPVTAPAVVKAAKNEIILEALDKVEVRFQVKGETKRVSLGPTQVHTIHAELPMTLDLSDGGAVNIILNGRERGVPGDLGKPKTIKIP